MRPGRVVVMKIQMSEMAEKVEMCRAAVARISDTAGLRRQIAIDVCKRCCNIPLHQNPGS